MRTFSRSFAVQFLFVLCVTHLLCTPAEAARRQSWRSATAAAPEVTDVITSTNGYRFLYAEDGTVPSMSIVDTPRFKLLVPKDLLAKHPLEDILRACNQGFDRIEKHLGRFQHKMNVFIPCKIVPAEAEVAKRLQILGLQFNQNAKEHIAVAIHAVSVDIFAHEALHFRLHEMGIRPIWWLDEGIAEFVETADGINSEHLKKLADVGPIPVNTLNKLPSGSKDEMRARATAWAIVYYQVKVKKLSLADVARASTVPESDKAFEAVRSIVESDAKAKEAEALVKK